MIPSSHHELFYSSFVRSPERRLISHSALQLCPSRILGSTCSRLLLGLLDSGRKIEEFFEEGRWISIVDCTASPVVLDEIVFSEFRKVRVDELRRNIVGGLGGDFVDRDVLLPRDDLDGEVVGFRPFVVAQIVEDVPSSLVSERPEHAVDE